MILIRRFGLQSMSSTVAECVKFISTARINGVLTDKISSITYGQGRGNDPLEEQLEVTSLSSVATMICNTSQVPFRLPLCILQIN